MAIIDNFVTKSEIFDTKNDQNCSPKNFVQKSNFVSKIEILVKIIILDKNPNFGSKSKNAGWKYELLSKI